MGWFSHWGLGMVVVFAVGWGYGCVFGFAVRPLYDDWFRGFVDRVKRRMRG